MDRIRKLFKGEKGVTSVEYAIMVALVALAIALATPNIRTAVLNIFDATSNALNTMTSSAV